MRILSPHFKLAEFRSRDGARTPPWTVPKLRTLCRRYLEPLRERYGPVVVVSGVRSRSHNANVGGAPASYHLAVRGRHGAAADVVCATGSPREWHAFLERLNPPGLGLYSTFVHVDTRTSGRARW